MENAAFTGRTAIVTGGASGIGRALAEGLVSRGARVVVADVNEALAREAAAALGGDGKAEAARVDVTDAEAVRRVVEETAGRHGKLDYLFNNAGIAIFGDTADLTLDDWNRTIDVNLRGVVHGVAAAYPIMVAQRSGHIVNTASAAGLLPSPSATAYAATKHAVVGLSVTLRAEAARFGVRVSAICPGFIRTPIVEAAKIYTEKSRDELMTEFPFRLYPAEYCARKALRGVERNKGIIPVTPEAHVMWRLFRLAPGLVQRLVALGARQSPLLPRRPRP